MGENVPFTVYDALGYLAAGAIVLVAATIAVMGELPTELTLATAVGVGIGSYVLGHILASVSDWILDDLLFNKRWGLARPEMVLLRGAGRSPWKAIFRAYHRPLPKELRKRVLEKAEELGIEDQSLLAHAEAVVQRDEKYAPRVERAEMLTIFLRNSCIAFAIAALILALTPPDRAVDLQASNGTITSLTPDLLAVMSLLAAVILLFRYVDMAADWRRRVFLLYAELE